MNKLKLTNLAWVRTPPPRGGWVGLVLVLFFILFTTCKKYDEGGFVYKRITNLFGENKDMASKSWKLKLYEVNGIDSTGLIKGYNIRIDGNDNFVKFYMAESRADNYYASTSLYSYRITVEKKEKLLYFSSNLFSTSIKNDSSQCFIKDGNLTCQRNIFNPEKNKSTEWTIVKLKKTEVIITKQLNNSYKIILTQ